MRQIYQSLKGETPEQAQCKSHRRTEEVKRDNKHIQKSSAWQQQSMGKTQGNPILVTKFKSTPKRCSESEQNKREGKDIEYDCHSESGPTKVD